MLKAQLEALARQPGVRTWIGSVPVHGQRLRDLLRAIPEDYSAELAPDGSVLVLRWHTTQRRGCLSLRAVARPAFGPSVAAALLAAQDVVHCQQYGKRQRQYWRVSDLPKELWAAVRPIFGEKKYANHSAEDAVRMIVEYGWRDFT